MNVSSRALRASSRLALFVTIAMLSAGVLTAQPGVGPDTSSRWRLYTKNVVRLGIGAVGFAVWDQIRDQPEEWGDSWPGFGRRVASEVGGAVLQESITEGLAAVMNRPVTYRRCPCRTAGEHFNWALKTAVLDPMPQGRFLIAWPRIIGAYAGAFAQSTWWPNNDNRVTRTLVNGTATLAWGAVFNLAYEFVFR